MKFHIIILILLGFFSTKRAVAHHAWCGTHEPTETDSLFELKVRELQNSPNKRNTAYVIPIVFHIIHQNGNENVSDEAIEKLVENTNKHLNLTHRDTQNIRSVFKEVAADCQITLRLAKMDPSGNCTNGINRIFSDQTTNAHDNVKDLSRWPNTKYLNVWVVKSISGSSEEGITLGYAYYPASGISRPKIDGIVMRSDAFNRNTLTHELGHYLNLIHTFQGGCSGIGDRIDDTPPTAEPNFGCPKSLKSCNSATLDQIENHMDYSNCAGMLTYGQRTRMHAAIQQYRSQLVSEANLKATGVSLQSTYAKPLAGFKVNRFLNCLTDEVELTADVCSHDPNTSYTWFVQDAELNETNSAEIKAIFKSIGNKNISLVVSNSVGKDSVFFENAITIITNDQALESPINFGFEDDLNGVYFDYNEDDFIWQINNQVGFSGSTKSIWVNNYNKTKISFPASFIIGPINIQELNSQKLKYHIAYARRHSSTQDAFRLYASTNCGESWILRKIEVANRLETTGERPEPFVPNEAENWREDEIDLAVFKNYPYLLFKFEFTSKSGNNIYIDNIRIGDIPFNINKLTPNDQIEVYPNPASQQIQIDLSNNQQSIEITNLVGQVLFQLQLTNQKNLRVDISNWPNGVYIVNATGQYGRQMQKFLKSN